MPVKCVGMNGDQIKRIRTYLDESQAQFGRRFEVSRQVIHNWEQRGTPSRGISVRVINRIIRGLPVPANLLAEKSGG